MDTQSISRSILIVHGETVGVQSHKILRIMLLVIQENLRKSRVDIGLGRV